MFSQFEYDPKKRKLDSASTDDNTNTVQYPPNKIPCTNTAPFSLHNSTEKQTELEEEIELSAEQQRIVEAARRNENCFVSGAGGCGKSVVIEHIVKDAVERGRKVGVVSFMGVAAIHIGGTTLHSFCGLRAEMPKSIVSHVHDLRKRATKGDQTLRLLCTIDVLIIDEISTLSGELLEFVNNLLRCSRNDIISVFGGVQLIVSGDFWQLQAFQPGQQRIQQAYEAQAWKQADFSVIPLHKQFRQDGDAQWASALSRIRFAEHTEEDNALLRSCVGRKFPDDGIEPIHLYGANRRADEMNARKLALLKTERGAQHIFDGSITVTDGDVDAAKKLSAKDRRQRMRTIRRRVLKGMRAPEELDLRVGANVMLLHNLDVAGGLGNGTRGVIVGFTGTAVPLPEQVGRLPVVRFENGRIETIAPHSWHLEDPGGTRGWTASYSQIPLMLSWAISIHKAQGLTLRRVVSCITRREMHSPGMAYVVCSRVRSSEDLSLEQYEPEGIYADPLIPKQFRTSQAA